MQYLFGLQMSKMCKPFSCIHASWFGLTGENKDVITFFCHEMNCITTALKIFFYSTAENSSIVMTNGQTNDAFQLVSLYLNVDKLMMILSENLISHIRTHLSFPRQINNEPCYGKARRWQLPDAVFLFLNWQSNALDAEMQKVEDTIDDDDDRSFSYQRFRRRLRQLYDKD